MDAGETIYIGDGAYLHYDGYGFELRANSHVTPTDCVYIDGPGCAKTLEDMLRAVREQRESGDDKPDQENTQPESGEIFP